MKSIKAAAYFCRKKEIAEALAQFKRNDHEYYEHRRVHKAYYSPDLDNGIENDVLFCEPSPQEIYEKEIAKSPPAPMPPGILIPGNPLWAQKALRQMVCSIGNITVGKQQVR